MKIFFKQKQIKILKDNIKFCKNTKNSVKCQEKIYNKINKIEHDIKILRNTANEFKSKK